MTPEQLPLILFWLYAAINFDDGLSGWLGSSRYNLQEINLERQRRKSANTKRYRQRPRITIIVLAHNNMGTIERCLKSITNSSYRNYDVVVADRGSSDETVQLVQKFITNHRKQRLLLLKLDKGQSRKEALLAALTQRKHSGLVLPLSTSSRLERHTFSSINQRFIQQDGLQALRLNRQADPEPTLRSLLAQWHNLLQEQSNKLKPPNAARLLPHTVYRRDCLERLLRGQVPKRVPGAYASNITIRGRTSDYILDRPQSFVGLMMLVLEPLVLSYAIYLAVVLKNPLPLAVAWLLVSMRYGAALLGGRAALKTKLALSALLPTMFLVLYLRSFGRLVAVPFWGLKSLFLVTKRQPALNTQ